MIDITKRKKSKYFLFGSLYFSEGLELALASVIIPIYLMESGYDYSIATVVAAVAMIPWTLKFIWGGITDYFNKLGRKKFILFGGILSIISLFFIAFIDPSVALIPFSILLFISHSGITFLDVSADAWAIELAKEDETGKINGAMFTGLFTGSAVGGIIFGYCSDNFGFPSVFLIGGLIILITILFPLLVKETKKVIRRKKVRTLLIAEFKKKNTQLISIFGPLSAISTGLIFFIVPLYMRNVLMLSKTQIGLISAIFPIMTIFGCISGGFMSDRLGKKTTLFIFLGAGIFFCAALIFAENWFILAVIYGIIGLLIGGYYVSGCALIMDITNPKIGATQYSLFTSLYNIGEWAGGTIGGTLIVLLGFTRVFLFTGWIIGPSLIILYLIKSKR